MRLDDFRAMVERMTRDVPREYLAGIAEVTVSPKTVPHPELDGVWTMGECIPLDPQTDPVQSRVVLYHGSFGALARERPAFDWREEAWETLTHELRHHLEWRANAPDLEAYDWAADQNFLRQEDRPFDPLFFQAGERVAPGITRVEDDVFMEHVLRRRAWRALAGTSHGFEWRGVRYEVALPAHLAPITYLVLDGVDQPPPGDLVLVLRRSGLLWDLLAARRGPPLQIAATARPVPASARPPGRRR